ncbi:MAG: hypothetical protein CME21_03090 [Gemmatimonadetes bacterium]|jgi:hypothetical protein|nr:hypothetical protein [Gemmatimonadota bacterium]HCK11269.1 hypothetical protein [Candidatus Latescibacterota bacterium]
MDAPKKWVEAAESEGYRPAFCPLKTMKNSDAIAVFQAQSGSAILIEGTHTSPRWCRPDRGLAALFKKPYFRGRQSLFE